MTTQEWWKKTTPECSYNLTVFNTGGESIQEVDLTPEEFGQLKDRLAELRGLAEPDPTEKPTPTEEPTPSPILNRSSKQGFALGMFSQLLASVDDLGLQLLDDIFHESQSTKGKELLNEIGKALNRFAKEHGIKLKEAA